MQMFNVIGLTAFEKPEVVVVFGGLTLHKQAIDYCCFP